MENKKQAIVLSVVAIVALLSLILGATYAYFRASGNSGSSTNVNVTTYTSDLLTFEIGDDIAVYVDQTSFASGKGNATGSTYAKATLVANNKTNEATKNYYVYLNISENTFTYTQNESTPELLLTIKDTSGNEITSITGLTHKTVTDGKGASISGFDITTKSGVITLFDKREITATPTKTEEWNITVTFVNYNVNQTGNAGKSFNAKLMIQKEEYKLPTLAEYVISQYTGTQGENSLYYHNSSLTNGAGDNSYRYAGGDYVLTDAGKATGATMLIGYNNTLTTALTDFYCNGTKQYVGYECSSSQTHYYLIKGDTTQYQTYNEALNASVEKGYLTKDNVKNFVCFGTDASPCPTENLYRIIGVFNNQVKLVKWDYAKSSLLGTDGDFSQEYSYYFSGEQGESPSSNSMYYWNNAGTNTWSESNLNKINLNTNFVNNIGTIWAKKIATTTWKVGGGTWSNIGTSVPKTAYQYEVGSNASTTTYEAKIGLMYVTDYYYSASPSAWTLVGNNESDATKDYRFSKGENWLYGGGLDWTISRNSDYSDYAFYVYNYGFVHDYIVYYDRGARPSFNLLSSTTYVSGDGTKNSPIRIN